MLTIRLTHRKIEKEVFVYVIIRYFRGRSRTAVDHHHETSSEKAAVYRSRYEASIGQDNHCLGSYVFLWGQKQERTPTWYGLFTEAGEENEVVDVMQYLWSNKWPTNRAPHLDSLLLNGKKAADFVYVEPGKSYPIDAFVTDPDGDTLTTRWEILHESTDLKEGGDREERPKAITGLITQENQQHTHLKAPTEEGAYRLFVYVSDGHNNVATANIPFYVTAKKSNSTQSATSTNAYRFSSEPVWADEFNYEGLPDTTKWSYDVGSLAVMLFMEIHLVLNILMEKRIFQKIK